MAPDEIWTALEAIGRQNDDSIDLAESALLLAALEQPDADLGTYRRHLAQLASDLADLGLPEPDTLEAQADALQKVMVARHGYMGDAATYDDVGNANLIRVIDRRRGLPVALGILYLHAARAQGWRSYGINFPGHFLVTIESDDERVILDPFDQGITVDAAQLGQMLQRALGVNAALEPEHSASMTNRGVLLRLQNNIKKRVRDAGDLDHAGRTLDSMIAIAPDVPDLWREAAELRAETGNLRSALQAVDRFLLLSPDSERADAMALRRSLATRIN